MRIALVTIDFPPFRTSAAVQMRDLAIELRRQGHEPVVFVPASGLGRTWHLETQEGVEILRLDVVGTRNVGYVRRALGEFLLPFGMLRSLRGSPHEHTRWDGVVWYSPTIFFGPFVRALKKRSHCRGYLILRDVFPEWAVDLGLLRKGLAYWLLKAVATFQYSVADVIGVQTHSNKVYLERWARRGPRRLEVLQNWLAIAPDVGSSINVAATALAGRKIFVYAGNMGVAQGMDVLLELAFRLAHRTDIGFLFVGRGSEYERLSREAADLRLDNVLFFNEIQPTEIPGLFAQCHVGLLVLDPRHKSHNIPGKFLTYLQAGLPVLAKVNPGTDLIRVIEGEGVGLAYAGDSVEEFARLAGDLADNSGAHATFARRGRELGKRMFAPESAAEQICRGLGASRSTTQE